MVITSILNLLFSFGASSLFGVLFNSPRYLLVPAGIVGAIGWGAFKLSLMWNGSDIESSFIGGFFIGVMSHLMSKRFLSPVILFIIPGIIPLVPGGPAYESIKNLVLNDYHEAIITMIEVALISSSIALGLLIADLLSKMYFKSKKQMHLKKINN
ncbi:threonine/serine exporter family protein [Mammaliicoccus sp. Dog046]|uniref:threonine/serine exporter family protein n=1 Tax=Mammaliicoccus sp. Dog046 TaxID=3034233 RepID=UPI002B258C20|nr:threonine/serine exporter family protein [Mammaliicoccus sp. Dog046]WQK85094.1 threonine/serine exporter family protein [Mammaliicoccus sp. Dog046]